MRCTPRQISRQIPRHFFRFRAAALPLALIAAAAFTVAAFAAAPPLPRHKPDAETTAQPQPAAQKAAPVSSAPAKQTAATTSTAAPAQSASSAFSPRPRTAGVTPKGVSVGNTSALSGTDTLAVTDVAEGALPDYPAGALTAIGRMQTYVTNDEDTFIDISRNYDLGYVELRAANPDVDPWSPMPGTTVIIPSFKLLPRAPQDGIVVNLGEMRLYYFDKPGAAPVTHPLGIGQEGLNTPTGSTSIIRKVAGPSWFPTARMRKEKPWLPAAVPPGPSNPLGTHALYLGWPEIRIHGSNKPWGIGRRVSSGCMRMYPEDIVRMFDAVPVGTHVTVVDQPILVGWVEGTLYLEANPSKIQSNEIEVDGTHETQHPLTAEMRASIIRTAGNAANRIDWDEVDRVIQERRGYPVAIIGTGEAKNSVKKAPPQKNTTRYQYN